MGKYVSLEWENKVKLQPYKFLVFVCLGKVLSPVKKRLWQNCGKGSSDE